MCAQPLPPAARALVANVLTSPGLRRLALGYTLSPAARVTLPATSDEVRIAQKT